MQDAKRAFKKMHASCLVWLTGRHFTREENGDENAEEDLGCGPIQMHSRCCKATFKTQASSPIPGFTCLPGRRNSIKGINKFLKDLSGKNV